MIDSMDFNNMNLGDMMNQVQDIAAKVKENGEKQVFTSNVGGGLVNLSINGNSEVINLEIDDSLLSDKDTLQTFLISAMNDVIKQSDENKKAMAMNMMGGMNPFNNK